MTSKFTACSLVDNVIPMAAKLEVLLKVERKFFVNYYNPPTFGKKEDAYV